MAFLTIHPRFTRELSWHEAGHATAACHLLGIGSVARATLWQVAYYRPYLSASDQDKLAMLAAGIRSAQFFGAAEHYGSGDPDHSDTAQASRIWSRMPNGVHEWIHALDVAAAIVRQRAAFVEELAFRLEHASTLSGDEVDAIWLSFYPAQRYAA